MKTISSKGSIAQLRSIVEAEISKLRMKNFTMFQEPMRPQVSTEESEIMNILGKNLMKVAEIRDEYPSVPCDCCEQLKLPNEVKVLGSFSKRKGFDYITKILQEETYEYVPKKRER